MKDIVMLTSIPARQPLLASKFQQARKAEFERCLENNCNTEIDRIIVFFQGSEEAASKYSGLTHEKVEVIFIRERPKYTVFFDYANEHLAGDYVIASNADVYFDPETPVGRVRELKPDHLWALCRYERFASGEWELTENGVLGSYDNYIFCAPIKRFKDDVLIGTLGCDSYMIQKAVEASIRVANPCLSLVTKHVDDFCSPEYSKKEEFRETYRYSTHFHPDRQRFPYAPSDFKYFSCVYQPWPTRIEDNIYASNQGFFNRLMMWLLEQRNMSRLLHFINYIPLKEKKKLKKRWERDLWKSLERTLAYLKYRKVKDIQRPRH